MGMLAGGMRVSILPGSESNSVVGLTPALYMRGLSFEFQMRKIEKI